jgi:osmotically-inducible protein OsmY
MHAAERIFQILFSAVLLSVVLGCAGNTHKENTSEYVDDSWITSKVKAAFVKDKTLTASEINVDTLKGTVHLTGVVKDRGDVSHAGEVTRDIKGVMSVNNDIQVR